MRIAIDRASANPSRGPAQAHQPTRPAPAARLGAPDSAIPQLRPPTSVLALQRIITGPPSPLRQGDPGATGIAEIPEATKLGTTEASGARHYLGTIQRPVSKHDVQLRAGVRLPGGESVAGHQYEHRADAVADSVAQDRSVEPLPDKHPDTAAAHVVQCLPPLSREITRPQPVGDGAAVTSSTRLDLDPPTAANTCALTPINRSGLLEGDIEWPAQETAIRATAHGGEPLPRTLRSYFESRLSHHFGDVRVHRDGNAARAAALVDAAAYSIGNHIVFGNGQYSPETEAGRVLIAHELAHVVQQRAGADLNDAPESPAAQQEASRAAQGARLGGGRMTVEGRTRAGIAREPLSLRRSVVPSTMSESELEQEVDEIHQWLTEHPRDSVERQMLLSVLPELAVRLQTRFLGQDELAAAFNDEFRSVLHAFTERYDRGGPVTTTPGGQVGQASGEQVPPATLRELFTENQRDKLMDFILTRRIPERLFSGDDAGTATAPQRLLLSAYILAHGTYRPGSFDQSVHARMCWHWVQIVHHYAGVTPMTGPVAAGVMGSFDSSGGVVLGSGQMESDGSDRTTRIVADELPSTEIPGGAGPIDSNTRHADAAAAERARREADPTTPRLVHRRTSLPMERFRDIRPGDWLWIYNGNASAGGAHSVIFSRWTSEQEETDGYREAICFSQNSPASGGREHAVRLGDRFIRSEHVFPIIHVSRVGPNARPASTPADLLPNPGGRRATALMERNQRFLQATQRRLRLPGPIDLVLLRAWIRETNLTHIVRLGERLTPGQRELLEQANTSEEIGTLVHLNQRLRALVINAAILERNMRRTFDDRLAEGHAQVQYRLNEERARTEQELAEIDAELEPSEEGLEGLESIRSEVDLGPEILSLRREAGSLWAQIQHLPSGPERDELRQRRQELLERVEVRRADQSARRRRLREVRAAIRELHRLAHRLQRRRQRVIDRQAQAERALPYGLMHPGPLRGQESGRTTGRLADLDPQPDWATLVKQEGEEPR